MTQPRDVEFKYTAKDDTAKASESVTKRMADTGKKSSKAIDNAFTRGLISSVAKVSPKFAADMAGMFAQAGGKGGYLLAAGVAAGAPLIGSVVSAAVIGGVGVGGIIGGVSLAARDPRVASAGKALGQTMMTGLEADSESFIQPTLDAIDQVAQRSRALRPAFRSIFDNSAEFVGPFTDRVLDGVEGVIRGVDSLISRAEPVMESLGSTFAETGESVGFALHMIGGGSEEAADGLNFLNASLGTTIRSLGISVRALNEMWGSATYGWRAVRGVAEGLHGEGRNMSKWMDPATDYANQLATAQFKLALHTKGVSGPIVTLTDQINDMSQSTRDAFSATTNLGAALDAADDAIKANGKTLSEHTEKGRANREALSNVASAMRDQYNATVAVNGEGEKSIGVANNNREAFVRLARQMGASRSRAEELATELGILGGKNVNPRVTVNDKPARDRIAAVQRALNNLRDKHVRIFVSQQGEVTYGRGGGRQASNFNARQYASVAAAGDGVHRAEPPRPVRVSSDVNVFLDGAPFYARTHAAVRESEQRQAWRTNVGYR